MENSPLKKFLIGMLAVIVLFGFLVGELHAARFYVSVGVSSSRSFTSNERPFFTIYAYNASVVRIFVYKIDDPLSFFASLKHVSTISEDDFANIPASIYEETGSWWDRLTRRFVKWRRKFFSYSFRKKVVSFLKKVGLKGEGIAERRKRYLNIFFSRQKLLYAWSIDFGGKRGRWYYKKFYFKPDGNGVYLVKVSSGGKRAYTVVIVSDIKVILKSDIYSHLLFVADAKKGKPLRGVKVFALKNKKYKGVGETDSSGICRIRNVWKKNVSFIIGYGNNYAVLEPYIYPYSPYDIYFATDRPVYKPADVVYFKGFVRRVYEAGYRVPTMLDRKVELVMEDLDDNIVFKHTYQIDEMGAFDGKIVLPERILPGYYSLVMKYREYTFYNYLYIRCYKKPMYVMSLSLPKKKVIQGEKFSIGVNVRFYFGQPVSGLKVFCRVYYSRGKLLKVYEGKTDVEGNCYFDIDTDIQKFDRIYTLDIVAKDARNATVYKNAVVYVYQGDIKIVFLSDRYVFDASEPVSLKVKAEDLSGAPASADASFFLYRVLWVKKGNRWHRELRLISVKSGHIDKANGYIFRQKVKEKGYYLLVVKSTDSQGRVVYKGKGFMVSAGFVIYGGVKVVSDKKVYVPGDTARVYISVPKGEKFLFVTLDGMKLMKYYVAKVKDGLLKLEIPITTDLVGGFYVYTAYIRNSRIYSETVPIKVLRRDKIVKLTLQTNKKRYSPGESGTITIIAEDFKGKPVEGEFYVSVIDKSIFSIEPFSTDIVRYFYAKQINNVFTTYSISGFYDSFSLMRFLKSAIRNKVVFARGKNAGGKVFIRKRFKDTAVWFGSVKTDKSGRVVLHFRLPDDLTTWIIRVEGAAKDGLVGSTQSEVTTSKDVMVVAMCPEIVHTGDELQIGGRIFNFTEQPHLFTVGLKAKGFKLLNGVCEKEVYVAAGSNAVVNWLARALEYGRGYVELTAVADHLSDGVRRKVVIKPPYPLRRVVFSGVVPEGQLQKTIRFKVSGDSYGFNRVSISLSSSISGILRDGFLYLDEFPYECNEQVASFLYAVASIRNIFPAMVNERYWKVRGAIRNLALNQLDSGGWSWWGRNAQSPYLSAYITHVFHMLKKDKYFGRFVYNYILDGAVAYLTGLYKEHSKDLSLREKAMIIYTLSEFPGNGWIISEAERLFKGAGLFDGTLLVCAIYNRGKKRVVKRYLPRLKNLLSAGRMPYLLIGESLYARLLMELGGDKKEIDLLVNKIIQQKRAWGWYSTQDTAWIISLLSFYQSKFGVSGRACTGVKVYLNNHCLISGTISHRKDNYKNVAYLKADNSLVFTKKKGVPLFYSIVIGYADSKRMKPVNRGIYVKESIFSLKSVSTSKGVVYVKEEIDKFSALPLKKPLLVVLDVSGEISKGDYVVADARLPAGFEVLPAYAYPLAGMKDYGGWPTIERGRVVLFKYVEKKGILRFYFVVRANFRGRVAFPPATVYRMYLPDVMGTTGYRMVEVR